MSVTKNAIDQPLSCLIVDDEPIARAGIKDFIEQVDFLQLVGSCGTAMEASDFIHKNQVDLLFLDINMPYLSGLELLESMENPPLTILTTAYSEHALEGYRLQIVDYLLKPIPFQRFHQAATKARQLHHLQRLQKQPQAMDPYLFVRQKDSFKKIQWADILYVEGMQNYAKLKFIDQELIIHQTLVSLEEILPAEHFFRIHKSYLVNISKIDVVSGGRIFIGDHELPISRHRREDILKEIVYNKLISR
ncbi:LytTR family DNA-binding domain-containing protein [Pedobacter gandavensis]|uniref:LytR/AlgR family response regulator transcription factor n=1 Tax=Pedobacter gandavensis TaxID=2679963 RepID=UPI002930B5F7|nr:LytTR family DNA-binding domain-containing protein [Pedobacter gandavensis]